MSLSKKEELILKKIAANMRLDIIKMLGISGSGHPGGSLSIAELLTTLYFKIAKYDAKDPKWPDRDRVILSKGHCTPGFYTALSYAGFFSRDLLSTFRKFNSDLQGHTDINTLPGVENCGGPLGQGLSVGLGCAIAGKMDSRGYKVYVIMGDGECEKGSINEAARLAGVYQMDNLIAFLDHNKIDQDGRVADVTPQNYKQEWKSYGWQVFQIHGNDVKTVYETILKAHTIKNKPVLIILETLKGKGISFMEKATLEGNPQWHGTTPKGEFLEKAIAECQEKIAALEKLEKQEVTDIFAWIKQQHITSQEKKQRTKNISQKISKVVAPELYKVGDGVATRDAFGKYIVALGRADERIVTLTAGVAGSVKYEEFSKEFGAFNAKNRKGRFVQIGIAEANMAGVAAGLAMCNKKPWMATFDIFIKEMLGVIRNSICYADVDVKIVGTHAGLGVEEDGGSHQTVQMPEIMNTMPNITVYEPCDANETYEVMQVMYDSNKAGYLRLTRQKLPVLQRPYHCKAGVGAYVLKDTPKPNVVIMASGASVSYAMQAAELLNKEKILAKIIDITNIDTLENNENDDFYRIVPDNVGIVTVHDASYKVLGHAVSRALTSVKSTNRSRILSLGIHGFGESGKIPELYAKHGIDVAGIVKGCRDVMKAQERFNKK